MNPQVLIVGAGPTGLTAALALAKLGVRVRIVDKNSSRSDKSKALGVQAGTLECLAKAIDKTIADQMIASGLPAREAWIHLNEAAPIRVDLSTIPSPYNFILILAQSETERILEEQLARLSVQVERQTELVKLEETGDSVTSVLKNSGGRSETVTSSFVVGCDGSHSIVRQQTGIPFHGAMYTGDFILGDVTIDWPWPYDSIQTFVSKCGVIASFPMKGDRKYRLILIPKENISVASDKPEIPLTEFNSILKFLSQGQIRATDATWLTRFRVHHRMVENFQKGRIFLAGDAAHIHSPAGGQGMNTGVQDALNLAHKLKRFLDGKIPIEHLATYERERLPVAKNVVRGTDFVFKMALLPETTAVRLIRGRLLPKIVRSSFIQRRVALAISEVNVARREMRGYEE